MLLQEIDGTYALTKSPALFNGKEEARTANAFAVATYAYGPPGPNGEPAGTPPDGYSGFVRKDPQAKVDGQAPFDIGPPQSAHKLEHQETIVTANGMVAVVYLDKETNEIILGFKGSASPEGMAPGNTPAVTGQALTDWKTNLESADRLPEQYKESADLLASVLEKYKDSKIVVAGHSKGGGQVQYALMANRRAIEARDPKLGVQGVGIDPAMPAGPMKDLIARGLVDTNHPEKDEFAKKHIQLYAVRTTHGKKEVLSSLNETVISKLFGGAYLGQTNILFTDEHDPSPSLDVTSSLASYFPGWGKWAVKGSIAFLEAAYATQNHSITVACRAFANERHLPPGTYYKAAESGNMDLAWAEDRNSVPHPGNLKVQQWQNARKRSDDPKAASAPSVPSA